MTVAAHIGPTGGATQNSAGVVRHPDSTRADPKRLEAPIHGLVAPVVWAMLVGWHDETVCCVELWLAEEMVTRKYD